MQKDIYFDGRQIKNYLIGFASVFSEIPYRKRNGKLESVPIHYGSPSDIISHLERNVDNTETSNYNRLKDVSIPMFSFRMVSMERNVEKRRAPFDKITVDLKPLGYNTGYTTMMPSPIRFNMELTLWASSDYQCFEIMEQIIPYFNSPQQLTIEPLPKCRVSTSELGLESMEIDTEPDSNKYSAKATLTFNLNGWLLSQPKIWSTNMQFEFNMLDKDTSAPIINDEQPNDLDIISASDINNQKEESSEITFETFIKDTRNEYYGDLFDYYKKFVDMGIVKGEEILSTNSIEFTYSGRLEVFDTDRINLVIKELKDLETLYLNYKQQTFNILNKDGMIGIVDMILMEKSEYINVFLTLLDKRFIDKRFNEQIPITNTEKLNIFGTLNIDIESIKNIIQYYISAIENIKFNKHLFDVGLENNFNKTKRLIFNTPMSDALDVDEVTSKIEFKYDDISENITFELHTEPIIKYVENGTVVELELSTQLESDIYVLPEHIVGYDFNINNSKIYNLTVESQEGILMTGKEDRLEEESEFIITNVQDIFESSFFEIEKIVLSALLLNYLEKIYLLEMEKIPNSPELKIYRKFFDIDLEKMKYYRNILKKLTFIYK